MNWNRLRPPLVEFDAATVEKIGRELEAFGFEMPGLKAA